MPSRGSYPTAAIYKGQNLLEQAGAGFGEVLLITDGGSSPAAAMTSSINCERSLSKHISRDGNPFP